MSGVEREALRALDRERAAMEKEMLDITEALQAGNMGGVSAPLVDAEGYPRADVDVHATRTMRHRLAILNTDYKALMTRIEQGLHAASDQLLEPFAQIDSVADGGPAATAGVSIGDLLLKFGVLHASNHDGLRALARLTQRSEGEIIPLLVQRGDTKLTLQLQPRRWAGAGLLGCHLVPL